MSTIVKQIRAAGFASLLGTSLISLAQAVFTAMTGNAAYPTPPIDLSVLKAGIDSYTAALAAALDGGKKALHERNAQRAALVRTLSALSHYAELNCKDDLTTFMSSGFQPAPTARSVPQQLPPASIIRIDSGANSGPMRALAQPLPPPVSGLTPGATYTFQVRALGSLGQTDWSDPVTRVCT
jgi:hypothetical protein